MTEPAVTADACVIAAVNDRAILAACLARSPDIAGGRLPLIVEEGARSAAEAYNRGLRRTAAPIAIFAHQDVYLPRGWLDRLRGQLATLAALHPDWKVAGAYGVAPDGSHVGRVWDVTLGRELGAGGFAPTAVQSLDEILLIVRREGGSEFDEELAHFHMYGTDVVQTALAQGRTCWALDLPLVHNNRPVTSLRGSFSQAYWFMRRKWRARLPIDTTICPIARVPLALWHLQLHYALSRGKRAALLADSATVARNAGYE